MRARLARTGSLVLAVTSLTAVTVGVTGGTSQADPRPSLAQVEQRITDLDNQAEALTEAYNGSQMALAAAAQHAAQARHRVAAAQAQLDAVRRQMSGVIGAAYRMGGNDPVLQLIGTSTPQTFLDRAGSLDRIAAQQTAELALAATARHRLEAASADMRAQLTAQQAITRQLASQKAQIQGLLAQQQQLLAGLKAEQRRALEAAQRAASERASRSRPMDIPVFDGPASARARVAVDAALAELGKPYQWGAAGPDSFDCSGLTMWAWGKAGVSLPHYTGAQWNVGRHVSRSELEPGDLIFYYSDLHHVALYIGGGRVVQAPHTGDVVKISPIDMDPYQGAVRVVG